MTEQQKNFEPLTPDKVEQEAPENMRIWRESRRPPFDALKTIKAGRIKGYTDINPQWRYQKLTELFGPVGEGWHYNLLKLWNEPGSDGQVFAFATIELIIGDSNPIIGVGGSMLITKEKSGLYSNDEAYKMAVTDALSVACKLLGIGADIYRGQWDGSQYKKDAEKTVTEEQAKEIENLLKNFEVDRIKKFFEWQGVNESSEIKAANYEVCVNILRKEMGKNGSA